MTAAGHVFAWPAWLAIGLLVLVYLPGLAAPLGYDDQAGIVEEPAHRSWSAAARHALRHPRPLLQLSYALEYRLHRLSPLGCRLFNLASWIGAIVAVGAALRAARRTLPAAPAEHLIAPALLLLAVHPFAVDGVTFVSGRGSILALLLSALSAWCYFRSRGAARARLWLMGSAALFWSALAAKESALGLALILVAAELAAPPGARRWKHCAIVVGPVPLLAAARVWLYGLPSASEAAFGWFGHFLVQTELLGRNLLFFGMPIGLSVDHGRVEPRIWAAALSLVGMLLLWLLARRHSALRWGLLVFLAFSLPWFLAPLPDTLVENRLIAPGVGAALVLAAALDRLPSRLPATLAVALLFAALTVERNRTWADPVALWSDAALKAPGQSRPRHNLGLALEAAGDPVGAERELRAALRLDPDSILARINLARFLVEQGRHAAAEGLYSEALARDSGCPPCRLGLGRIAEARGALDEARSHYVAAAGSARWPAEALLRLGNLDFRAGQLEPARAAFALCLELDPDRPDAWANLGLSQAGLGDLAAA
ncbi:MAG TPA: tetratricopeptide repeat protein, partial [Acidobacteriota bacterium]